ncbi:phosphatase PAP2 family protein [Nocardioides rubriscoriae]|uniref:phosphatase PAP2 family protein n=1 Tax=Nocardioides rubriscoriae TaxID=642762 RepID=UPI0011DF3EC9|nr:phosphatase PAP2 family protein [Nocardioides rubriscoriae]
MYRRAIATCIGVAATTGLLAFVIARRYDQPLLDPEGSFLGPSWIRLPLLLSLCLVLDIVPRMLWHSRLRRSAMVPVVKERLATHWTRDRVVLVVLGVTCFYVTYVGYRNLKSALPFVRDFQDQDQMFDRELTLVDRVLFFGHRPGPVLHNLLGTDVAAHVLSAIYLIFVAMVPLLVMAWIVWSRRISFGYWFVASQCFAWALGTASYYALPTLGPAFYYKPGYTDLAHTGTTDLLAALYKSRATLLNGSYDGQSVEGIVNSVAGFASLHCGITLLWALMVQFTVRSAWVKRVFWVYFGLVVVATIYFGWHYLTDDVAGIMIALVSFYLGGLATGQRFDRHSLGPRPPTEPAGTLVSPPAERAARV